MDIWIPQNLPNDSPFADADAETPLLPPARAADPVEDKVTYDYEERLGIEASDDTAHLISHDPWYQVGFVLTTGVNSAYVLGYSGSVMVPLGWVAGAGGLVLAAAISLYANALLARLHEVGGRRHIRYRDLAGHIYGRYMYAVTWALQYVNLFMINTGFIILAGQALKATYVLYRDDSVLKLPYCIAIAGLVCALFAFGIPHLSALRIWLGFSTFFSLIYIVIAFVLSLRDGINTPDQDYSIPGSNVNKIFTAIGATASLGFAYNTGMLPEIQATVKPPVIKNMEKALLFQFTVGVLPLYAVTFMGYWAYGSSTSSYLLNSVKGPIWVKTVASAAAFLQTVIALHVPKRPCALHDPCWSRNMFCSPPEEIDERPAMVLLPANSARWPLNPLLFEPDMPILSYYHTHSLISYVFHLLSAITFVSCITLNTIYIQIFASPMYEYLDTKYARGKGNVYSLSNVSFRILVRGGYLTVNTLVAALLPFLGDFMSLTGALSTYPLTFVLANHMYLKVKKNKLSASQKAWHWLNVLGFSFISIAAAVAAARLIFVDSVTYHLFADL